MATDDLPEFPRQDPQESAQNFARRYAQWLSEVREQPPKREVRESDVVFKTRQDAWLKFIRGLPEHLSGEDEDAFSVRYAAWLEFLQGPGRPRPRQFQRPEMGGDIASIMVSDDLEEPPRRGQGEDVRTFARRYGAWAEKFRARPPQKKLGESEVTFATRFFIWSRHPFPPLQNPRERDDIYARRCEEWCKYTQEVFPALQKEWGKRIVQITTQEKYPEAPHQGPGENNRDFTRRYGSWREALKAHPPEKQASESDTDFATRRTTWESYVEIFPPPEAKWGVEFCAFYRAWVDMVQSLDPPHGGKKHETERDFHEHYYEWWIYQQHHPPIKAEGEEEGAFATRYYQWVERMVDGERPYYVMEHNKRIATEKAEKLRAEQEQRQEIMEEIDYADSISDPLPGTPVPLSLPDADRAYYRETWGFDPATEYLELRNGWRRFEACFPLARDPPLKTARVTICARVDWKGEAIHNRIVFRRGDLKAAVECTHTVVYAGPAGEALNFAADAYTARDRLDPAARELVDRAGGPVTLPPWEHFAALKSYIVAIAEMGILAMLRHSIHSAVDLQEELPFGFNTALREQVVRTLRAIAAEVVDPFLQDVAAELVESTPPAFVVSRWEILNREGELVSAFIARPDLLSSWMQRWFASREAPGITPGAGVNLLISPKVATDLTDPLARNWRELVKVLNPADVTRLCRSSNLLDGLQDYIFSNQEKLQMAKNKAPDVPWEQLRFEWQARQVVRKYLDDLYVENERPLNPEEMPHVEIYPRGVFCEGQLLAPFTTQFPHLNTRTRVHQRLADLGAKLSKDDVEWIFIEQHPRIREEMDEEYQKNMTLARDPNTPPEILDNLARVEDGDVRQQVASHPATPPSALEYLTRKGQYSTSYLTDKLVAMHPATSPPILEFLSNSRDSFVKLAVMAHPATPASVLEKLSQDKEICEILAPPSRHRSTHRLVNTRPQQVNITSLEQVQKAAKCALAAHPQTPDFVLDRLALDEDPSTRGAVAGNSRTRPAILKRISEDNESSVKKMVAKNPATPVDVIEILKRDNDAGVREAAINNPASMSARTPEVKDTQSPDQFLISWRDWLNGRGKFPAALQLRHMPPEYVTEVTQEITQLGAHITRILAKETNDPKLLISLARHWDLPTKLLVVVNPRVTQDILEIMTQDVQPSVRAIAGARLRRGGNRIDPFPGEILTPGEILWLLVSREGNEISFAADRRGDYSPDYAAWISSFRGKEEPPLRFQTYNYDAGIIRDNYDHDRFTYIHLALDGIRDLVIGRWPCMYMFEF